MLYCVYPIVYVTRLHGDALNTADALQIIIFFWFDPTVTKNEKKKNVSSSSSFFVDERAMLES